MRQPNVPRACFASGASMRPSLSRGTPDTTAQYTFSTRPSANSFPSRRSAFLCRPSTRTPDVSRSSRCASAGGFGSPKRSSGNQCSRFGPPPGPACTGIPAGLSITSTSPSRYSTRSARFIIQTSWRLPYRARLAAIAARPSRLPPYRAFRAVLRSISGCENVYSVTSWVGDEPDREGPMRWLGDRESSNIEDRRGVGVARGVGIGGLGTVAIVLIGLFLGVDPSVLLDMVGGDPSPQTQTRQSGDPGYGSSVPPRSAGNDQMRQFVSVVLADTEDVWRQAFGDMGRSYEEPKLVLYSETVQSACGMASSASGPFYCPRGQKVYLDLSFFEDMRRKLNAPGDFAQAYVIAHEVGHHVQNELGILETANAERARSDKRRSNAISVRIELQADCIAGVWANRADRMRRILERGDIEEGLNAASAVGDDRLQRQARGVAVPDVFTHGSSAQRMHWFKTGLQSGNLKACDTFSTADTGSD